MRRAAWLLWVVILVGCAGGAATGRVCTSPYRMREAVGYREGAYLITYFVLEDEDGRETCADGKVQVILRSQSGHWIMPGVVPVSQTGFSEREVGSAKIKKLMYVLPRLRIDEMGDFPNQDNLSELEIIFYLDDGRQLSSKDTVIWN